MISNLATAGAPALPSTDQQMALLNQVHADTRSLGSIDDRRRVIQEALQSLGYLKNEVASFFERPMEEREVVHQRGRYTLLSTHGKRYLLLTHFRSLGQPIIGEGYTNCVKFAIDLTTCLVRAVRIAKNQPYGEGHPPPATGGRKIQWETEGNESQTWDTVKSWLYEEADFQRKFAAECSRIVPLLDFHEDHDQHKSLGYERVYQILPLYQAVWKQAAATATDEQIMQWTHDILVALQYIQKQGKFHGDMQEGNLFIDNEGRASLGDLGNVGGEGSIEEDLAALNSILDLTYSYGIRPRPKDLQQVQYAIRAWNIALAIRHLENLPFIRK